MKLLSTYTSGDHTININDLCEFDNQKLVIKEIFTMNSDDDIYISYIMMGIDNLFINPINVFIENKKDFLYNVTQLPKPEHPECGCQTPNCGNNTDVQSN